MSQYSTRFAPSPTGLLHLGHAASALFAFSWARKQGAKFHLRIEDIDHTRCKPEFEAAIFEDLHWLCLQWENPVRRQSNHMAEYENTLKNLQSMGLVYRCFLTRSEVLATSLQAPHGAPKIYFGPKKQLSEDEEQYLLQQKKPFAWRLSLARARDQLGDDWQQLCWLETGSAPDGQSGHIRARPELLGDVVLARKDIQTSYHLAVTHDDAKQCISHVIRGQDLFESTHIHVLLQVLLGWPTPTYYHHGLLLDDRGERLAKRDGSTSLRSLRATGLSPQEVQKMAVIS